MSNKAFISSAVLHGIVLTLMAMDFSFARFDNPPPPPAILMVDLSKVKIADKTNLPPKVTVKPKKEAQKSAAKQATPTPTKTVKTQIQPSPPPKPAPTPPAKNAAPVVEPSKNTEKKKQANKENITPKKAEPDPKTATKPSTEDKLKSLLASVDKVKRNAPTQPNVSEPKEMQINEGIEGGTEGSLSQVLSISERDLIASRLSACWNLDPGKKDIENIIIEVRVSVNKDGRVRDVEILNKTLNAVHRSVAESAKRAVRVCDQDGDKSPFHILAEKYAEHYGDWKSMTLRFNPMTGGIM